MTARDEFISGLTRHAAAFGAQPGPEVAARLADYFELVGKWNSRLHLVAPCAPEEFAARHVHESLTAAAHLPRGARFADVGAGAGLPSLPCLIARDDLRAAIVEASTKKAVFLREALNALGLRGRAEVVNSRFEDAPAPAVEAVTCRALERFTEMLPELMSWTPPGARLLLFGGDTLRDALERAGRDFTATLMHGSERRFLFVVKPAVLTAAP
jgi:16S rRNA (guanine527-N7)-methyltransferase